MNAGTGARGLFARPAYRFCLASGAALLAVALLALFYTPSDPLALDAARRLHPPSADHWLGTDHFGRDVLSRVMVGLGVSLKVSALSVSLALLLGSLLGALAGYFGGLVDRALNVVIDAFLTLPGILFALALVAVFGGSVTGLVVALGLAYTPNVARVVRGLVLSLRTRGFVDAARLMGRGNGAILLYHIVPNTVGPVTVLATSFFAQALLSESALSFLGLGVPPPYPSLGGILAESRRFIDSAPWLAIAPGATIVLTLLTINLLGDALRDHFDPRDRGGD